MRIAIIAISFASYYIGIHLLTKSEVEGAAIVGVFNILAGLNGLWSVWPMASLKKGKQK